jgi:hypothetical protein
LATSDIHYVYGDGICGNERELNKRYDLDPKAEINSFNISLAGDVKEQIDLITKVWNDGFAIQPGMTMERAIEIGINYCYEVLEGGVNPNDLVLEKNNKE